MGAEIVFGEKVKLESVFKFLLESWDRGGKMPKTVICGCFWMRLVRLVRMEMDVKCV